MVHSSPRENYNELTSLLFIIECFVNKKITRSYRIDAYVLILIKLSILIYFNNNGQFIRTI